MSKTIEISLKEELPYSMQINVLYHHCMYVGVLIEVGSTDSHDTSSEVNNTTEPSLEKELPNSVKNGLCHLYYSYVCL